MKTAQTHFTTRWNRSRTYCGIRWINWVWCVFFANQVTCKRCLTLLGRNPG